MTSCGPLALPHFSCQRHKTPRSERALNLLCAIIQPKVARYNSMCEGALAGGQVLISTISEAVPGPRDRRKPDCAARPVDWE